jgi:predicted HTH transcriptional regulator
MAKAAKKSPEWVDKLTRAMSSKPEGLTTREISEILGVHRETALYRIHEAIAGGWLEYKGRARRPTIDGLTQPVPIYGPVENDENEK